MPIGKTLLSTVSTSLSTSLWSGLSPVEKTLFGLFVLLKAALLLMVPLTGDEAYFILWGQNPSWGYYDHPPAIGWVNYLLSLVADQLSWYRSFAFASSAVIAYLLYRLLRMAPETAPRTAFYVALAFFVSPVSLMFVINANDTVLALFGVMGVYFFAQAMRSASRWALLWAGVCLGLAFLSKYFAAFLLIGLLLFSLVSIRQFGWQRPLIVALLVLLLVAENLWFNLTHCWNNILFNFFSRTQGSEVALSNVLLYLGMLALMLSPKGVYDWLRHRGSMDGWNRKLAIYAGLPLLLVLLLVSFSNVIGLHWPLLSIPLLYLLYAALPEEKLRALYVFNGVSSIVIAVLLLGLIPFLDKLVPASQQHQVPLYTHTQQVCEQLPEQTFFTLDYSSQSTLAYHCQNDAIHVFMSDSKYGREDDKHTDFKALDGQDMTLFLVRDKELKKVAAFFAELEVTPLEPVAGAHYLLVTGRGFDYAAYRESVLQPVYERFYRAPEWLPPARCDFKTHYDF
jgi:hypothetical protein